MGRIVKKNLGGTRIYHLKKFLIVDNEGKKSNEVIHIEDYYFEFYQFDN